MSIKSFIQILLLIIIISIITAVYFKYFDINKNIVEEINSIEIDNQDKIINLEKKLSELELKNSELKKIIINKNLNSEDILSENDEEKINKDNEVSKINEVNTSKVDASDKLITKKKDADNNIEKIKKVKIDEKTEFVKDIEYNSIDDKGNNFFLLAKSGRSNSDDKNVLDLVNVRGEISSDKRDTIYIVSDFGQFNSTTSNSKFYDNVVINYQEKQITCKNFDINMETNKAIAYNNVIITDPNSEMKAGKVEFDLKTKNIDINPQSVNADINVVTN